MFLFDLQLPENAELIWDDGSPFPEPCLDNVAPMVGKVSLGCAASPILRGYKIRFRFMKMDYSG